MLDAQFPALRQGPGVLRILAQTGVDLGHPGIDLRISRDRRLGLRDDVPIVENQVPGNLVLGGRAMSHDNPLLEVDLADLALFQRKVVIRTTSHAQTGREPRLDLPELLLAVGQAQGSAGGLPNQNDLTLKNAGQIEIITPLGLPERLAVAQIQTMNGTAVRRG